MNAAIDSVANDINNMNTTFLDDPHYRRIIQRIETHIRSPTSQSSKKVFSTIFLENFHFLELCHKHPYRN